MGTLKDANPNAREFVTEILDETLWRSTLKTVVQFLLSKGVDEVCVEFGYLLDRDLRGEPQPENDIVRLVDLESFIDTGLREGTIEWNASSDFLFSPVGTDLTFMLCNDADLHFGSTDSALLMELGQALSSSGIKVYESGISI